MHTTRKILSTVGYSNKQREENDFYYTHPETVEQLLERETFSHNIWECACGQGHISKVFEAHGYNVFSTDLIDRGYGIGDFDFLSCKKQFDGDIVTNPPYSLAESFFHKAYSLIPDGHKICFLLRLLWLEGANRYIHIFRHTPPKKIYVSSKRTSCGQSNTSAISFAWFVWVKGWYGEPSIRWFNTPYTGQINIFDNI